jgi:hypothetical protein
VSVADPHPTRVGSDCGVVKRGGVHRRTRFRSRHIAVASHCPWPRPAALTMNDLAYGWLRGIFAEFNTGSVSYWPRLSGSTPAKRRKSAIW